MRQLKPQDAQYLLMEDSNIASHITSVSICTQNTAPARKVRFKNILKTVEERLSPSPIYRQKLLRLPFEIDFPYWVDDPHFDLEYHVRHTRLPKPSDWRQFCIQVARFHSRPLDLSRPLWEMSVLEGLDNVEGCAKGSFAYCMKMHHAAVDGTSAQEFMALMLDLTPQGFPLLPPPTPGSPNAAAHNSRNLGAGEILARAAVSNATAPIEMMRKSARLAPQLARTAISKRFGKSHESDGVPVTRFNADTSPNKAFDAISFALDDFKMIAKAFDGVKVNDVVLAVTGGAMRAYLQDRNELPAQSLVITAPINKRGEKTAANGQEGNNITAMSVPLYTNTQNPIDRLKAISRATKMAKAGSGGLASRLITDLSQHIPAPTLASLGPVLLRSGVLGGRVCNAIVSNVMGPPMPVYFCGAEMTHSYGLAPIGGGVGLFITTPSYNGKMMFSITTTRQIMPDTPVFMKCLEKSLQDLKRAAAHKMPTSGNSGLNTTKNAPSENRPRAEADAQSRPKKRFHKTRARRASGNGIRAEAPKAPSHKPGAGHPEVAPLTVAVRQSGKNDIRKQGIKTTKRTHETLNRSASTLKKPAPKKTTPQQETVSPAPSSARAAISKTGQPAAAPAKKATRRKATRRKATRRKATHRKATGKGASRKVMSDQNGIGKNEGS